ncbi:MAG: TRAP transporter small permease [Methylobacteriaceae bacterium]|jgi:C4-dicarboxylate transporter DctQ subunit|nr:TRAP transporter small permease [Methylobacteriaceae bacterium]
MNKRALRISEWIAVILLLSMTLLTTANVFSRYVFHMSIALTEELTTNMFGLLSFIGAAIAAERGAHLGLTILTDHLSAGANRLIRVFACFVSMTLLCFVAWLGVDMVRHQIRLGNLSTGMQVPEWIYGLMVPFGCALIAAAYLVKVIELLRKGKDAP